MKHKCGWDKFKAGEKIYVDIGTGEFSANFLSVKCAGRRPPWGYKAAVYTGKKFGFMNLSCGSSISATRVLEFAEFQQL